MRRTRLVTAALGLLAVVTVAAGVLVPAAPASAAVTFTAPEGGFVGTASFTVSGTKGAGSSLVLSSDDRILCEVAATEETAWSCPGVSLANGVWDLAAVETLSDDSEQPPVPSRVRVLGPPTIDGAGTVMTTGLFTGVGAPGTRVELLVDGTPVTGAEECPATISSGFWSCRLVVPTGTYQVSARQIDAAFPDRASFPSSAVRATVDRDIPASPVVTSPEAGTRTTDGRLETRGTGEPGATVQVFASGSLLCETTAAGTGAWSCPIGLPSPGEWSIQVLQIDPAGNFSAPIAPLSVLAGPAGATPTPRPTAPGAPSPPADSPTPSPTPGPDGTPSPSPSAPHDGDASPRPSTGPITPTPAPPGSVATNWGTPSGFGNALPTLAQVAERGGLLLGLLVALGYLLLIALPIRAFSTAALPRLRSRGPRMLGRNRPAVVDTEPLLSPTVTAVAVFGVAALLAALSGSVAWEVRYLRLTAAIGLGLLVLNAVGVSLPARLAGRTWRAPVTVQLLPGILFAAAAAAVLTRFGELRPALLIGVVLVASAAGTVRMRARVGVASAQLGGVAVLSLLAWAAHDLLTPSTGFWMSLWSETAAAVALGGLGSLLLLLLPVGLYPGRALYAVSRPLWVVAALLAGAVAGAIFAAGANFPLLLLTLVAAAVAAVLMAITAWVRWVEPSLR
ncbi:Ig-like domain-containing protein [Microcella flavibacter]|uniref:Ig-like domain-containing protein n=1 Tax=Microcella flavibacter TaxID=1804990 RepID=UPI0014577AEC|nr:Ig-like domain-containing protein [Microcella flavibacter]